MHVKQTCVKNQEAPLMSATCHPFVHRRMLSSQSVRMPHCGHADTRTRAGRTQKEKGALIGRAKSGADPLHLASCRCCRNRGHIRIGYLRGNFPYFIPRIGIISLGSEFS